MPRCFSGKNLVNFRQSSEYIVFFFFCRMFRGFSGYFIGKMKLVAKFISIKKGFTRLLPRIGNSTGSRGHQIKDIKDSLWLSLLLNFSGKHNLMQSRYHPSTSYSITPSIPWAMKTDHSLQQINEQTTWNCISNKTDFQCVLGIPKTTSPEFILT